MSGSPKLALACWLSLFSTANAFIVSLPTTSTVRLPKVVSHENKMDLVTLHATWSDSRAVRDYQDFLNSGRQEVEQAKDQPSVVIHNGSDTTLAQCLQETGMGDDIFLTPDQALPAEINGSSEYPIYITLPPYQLSSFFDNLLDSYKERADNFCFFSGGLKYGNLEDVLKERGYARDSMTQCLIGSMQIAANGRPIDCAINLGPDSYGEAKMAGQVTATGKWAGAIAERLERSQVPCKVEFYREWRRNMWERSFYDAVFPLLGAVRDQPTTVAQVANYYGEEVSDMVWELTQRLRGWRAVTLLYGFEERLFGLAEMRGTEQTCQPLPDDVMFPYIWGMNVFMECQMVVDYLWFAKTERGFLQTVDLPKKSDEDYASHMRKGNLRADGVI